MDCKHQPVFKFSSLFSSKKPQVCRHCGAVIEMTPTYNMLVRVVYTLLIGLLLVKVFLNIDFFGLTGTEKFIADIAFMLGSLAVALVALSLLTIFGRYQAVQLPPETSADPSSDEKPAYTQDQLDLMALYESYEQQARDDGTLPTEAKSSVEQSIKVEEEICSHEPAKSWKNYVPSQYDFKCAKCGKPISFTAETKRKQNMMYLVLMVVIFMPTMLNQNVEWWLFILITVAVLAVGIVIQLMALKKDNFELKVTKK